MRAFIIRPFGTKKDLKGNEIDFNKVAEDLISPALEAIGAQGRETLDIVCSRPISLLPISRFTTPMFFTSSAFVTRCAITAR